MLPYEKWGTDIPYGEPEATAETAEELSKPTLVTEAAPEEEPGEQRESA